MAMVIAKPTRIFDQASPIGAASCAVIALFSCGAPADPVATSGASVGGTGTAGSAGNSVAGFGGASVGIGGSSSGSAGVGNAGQAGNTSGGTAVGMGGSSGADGVGGTATGGGAGVGGTSGAGGVGPGTPGCGLSAETGTYQAMVTAFGNERSYFMSVPESYDPNVPQRLIFGYHGSNYTGERMRQYLQLEEGALEEGTLFVYPDGIALDGQPDHIAWELGADERDIAFFDALFEKLSAEYCVDLDRVFVNGQSFGGLMTNAVGCARGNVVRAIAVVAGSGPRGGSCQGQVAAWLTHGTDDDSVSYSSGEGSRDHWAEANHCAATTMPTDPTPPCESYEGCDPGYPVIWCPHTDDGGHQHPGFGRQAVRQFFLSF